MSLRIDWAYLRTPLIVLVLAVGVGVALASAAQWWHRGMGERHRDIQGQLQASYAKYRRTLEEQRLMEVYRVEYERLQAEGVIGDEQRLTWIEAIRDINKILKLPEFQYSIDPQEAYLRPEMGKADRVERHASPMQLDLGLIHEGDLLAVLEGLRAGARGLFTVESCELTRRGAPSRPPGSREANLGAACELQWLTVDVAEQKRAPPLRRSF